MWVQIGNASARDRPEIVARRLNALRDGQTDHEARIVAVETNSGLGGLETVATAVCDADMVKGLPVVVDRATGKFTKALGSTKAKAFIAGLIEQATALGFVGSAGRGAVTLADWSAIAGTASLSPGQTYFLAAAGGITTATPATPNCAVVVGIAASPTVLMVDPSLPVQL